MTSNTVEIGGPLAFDEDQDVKGETLFEPAFEFQWTYDDTAPDPGLTGDTDDEWRATLQGFQPLLAVEGPVAVAGNVTPVVYTADQSTNEDTATSFIVDAIDPDGDQITLDSFEVTGGGTLSLLSTAGRTPTTGRGAQFSFAFDPAGQYDFLSPGQRTTETVTVQISDGNGGVTTQTFDITIVGINHAPTAVDDAFTVNEDTQLAGNVLDDNGFGADADVDGDAVTAVAETIATANGGTVVLNTDGSFTYDPALNFNGQDSFVYTLTDGLLTDTATATITVRPINDAPVAADDTFATATGAQLVGNVLADNGGGADSDIEGDALSVVPGKITTGNGGVVILNADGSFTYDPPDGFSGKDSFAYTLTDGTATDVGLVKIDVGLAAGAPSAVNDVALTTPTESVVIDVLENDDDRQNDPLTIISFTQPDKGSVVQTAPGVFTYTPTFAGIDVFSYTISDGNGGTSTARVGVIFNDQMFNTPPIALDSEINALIDDTSGNTLLLDFNTMTVDGLPIIDDLEQPLSALDITALSISGPTRAGAQFVEVSPGSNVFSLNLDAFNVPDGEVRDFKIEYTVEDGQPSTYPGNSADGVISLSVINPDNTPPNTPPVATDAAIPWTEAQGLIQINLAALGGLSFDANGDPLTVTSLFFSDALGAVLPYDPLERGGTGETGGIVTIDPRVFGLADGVSGTFRLNYTVSDGQAFDSGVVTLGLTGSPGNTPPTAVSTTETRKLAETVGNLVFNLNLLVNDPDYDPLAITFLSLTDRSGNPVPIGDALIDDGADGVVTPVFADGLVTINPEELDLGPGESIDLLLNYAVSDGVNPAVNGTLTATIVSAEPEGPPAGQYIEDFEDYSSDTGAVIPVDQIAGLYIGGTATVYETDELGARGMPGLSVGQTTVPPRDSRISPSNVAVITGDLVEEFDRNGFPDNSDGLPKYAATFASNEFFQTETSVAVPFGFKPEEIMGPTFDLKSMSITALSGNDQLITIIPYRIAEVSSGYYQYLALGEIDILSSNLDVLVSADAPREVDFTSGLLGSTFYDDPRTEDVTESAFENIVAFQIITTGTIIENDHLNSNNNPFFAGEFEPSAPLVIDDLVFNF